jgi:PAS domain S-box-containing protein
MTLVWFVYGLAFFVLGLVILVYPKKDSRFDLAKSISLIGIFGILHGLNEWLDMFIDLGGPLPPGLMAEARLLTLSGSFFFLVLFGVAVLARKVNKRRPLRIVPFLLVAAWLAALLFAGSQRRLLLGDIWARYLLCVPGTFLTGWALFSQTPDFKTMRLHSVRRNLAIAGITFFVYGVLAGLIVKKADFFPATILNYESFSSLTGLPVQIFRAACAVVAAWSIIRVLDVFRWETQEALRTSELRCATIASAMPVFLFMTDRDMAVTFVQGKGLDVLGLSAEQVRGRHIRDAFPGGQNLVEDCRRALSGQEFIATAVLDNASFEIYYSTLKDRTGTITSVVGVALDISARIQAQNELDEYRRKLERRAREAAVGVLSATVAQQLVEPLSVAQLMLDRATAPGSGVPDAIHGSISKGLSELLKARETLGRFMEMAHPGAMAPEQPVGLYQIAKRTMSVFADSAQRRRLTIAIKDMDIVPLMTVSPREVEQVFYHLIQRAMDAADGETEQRLVISCAGGEGYIDLLFSDTCGKIQPQQPEADVDSVLHDLEAPGGHGLGLAVVKGIVAGRGGRITVDTGPGNTTTFRVRLPVTRTY